MTIGSRSAKCCVRAINNFGKDKKKLWRDFERDYAEAIPNVVKVKFESLDNPEAISVGGYKISRELVLAE